MFAIRVVSDALDAPPYVLLAHLVLLVFELGPACEHILLVNRARLLHVHAVAVQYGPQHRRVHGVALPAEVKLDQLILHLERDNCEEA